MLAPERWPVRNLLKAGLLAVLLSGAAVIFKTQGLVLSASCGADCNPAPRAFTVPPGHRASQFQIQSLRAGEPCSGEKEGPMAGFSIRKEGDTVLVYYRSAKGLVSDPVPLEDLTLEPGQYKLLAIPAKGAAVSLSCALSPAQEK